jgi:hypothetical protein
VGIPVCYDSFRERHAYAGQTRQLGCGRTIGIESLARTERPRLLLGTVTLRRRGAGGQQGKKFYLARWFAGPGNQISDTLTGHREGHQKKNCPAFGTEHEGGYGGTTGQL